MLPNISANRKIKSIKILNPTSSEDIKGFFKQFKKTAPQTQTKVSNAPIFACRETDTGASERRRLLLSFKN